MTVKELNLKVQQKKADCDREARSAMKQDLMIHREKVESIYKEKLDEEKRKLLKGRVDEIDRLMRENKKLNA